jgi:Amt family ammonium transporter
MGALDFAGGTVVHLASGVAALTCALVLGKRLGHPQAPHNLTMTVLGAGILWFGWFGFNGGSAPGADGIAALAVVNTHLAAAAGALGWALCERVRLGKVTMLGVASGAVAGLVGITPAAGFVDSSAAMVIGFAAGWICYGGVMLKSRFGYDDALDAFGVHGVGGAFGALATGVFARLAVNKNGADGLLAGNARLLGVQALGVVVAGLYSALISFVLLKIIDAAVGLRVDKDAEREGLDAVLHGESGYTFGSSASPHRE